MSSSISRRLVFRLAIPLALLVLLSSLGDYYLNVVEELARSEQRLTRALDSLTTRIRADNGQIALLGTDPASLPALQTGVIRYAIRDTQQHLIAGDAQLPVAKQDMSMDEVRTTKTDAHIYLNTLAKRIDTAAGPITIIVGDSVDTSWPSARASFLGKLFWDFLLLDFTLIIAWTGITVGLRPLKELREHIAGRSPEDLQAIPESSAPQEIAPLISTLNRLFSIVRSSLDAQRHLVADTAHQLRTPITGINTQLELLLVDPAAAPIRDRLLILQEGVRQLTRSTNQLLTLARADSASNLAIHNKPVNLHDFTSELVARFIDRAVAADLDLGIETQAIWINVDVSLLDDLLSNLLDNALKYTPQGGVITVSAGLEDSRPFLEVDDTGKGIPESEYQRVRQRYYRTPNTPGHGSGLGLAIVEEIIRLYRGVLVIKPGRSGRGTCMRVLFPADSRVNN